MLSPKSSSELELPQGYSLLDNDGKISLIPPQGKVIFGQEQGDHIHLERVLMNFDPIYYVYTLYSGNNITNVKLFNTKKGYKTYEYEGDRFGKKAKYYFIEMSEGQEQALIAAIKRLYLQTLKTGGEVIKKRLQEDPIFFGRLTAAYPSDEIVDADILPKVKQAIQLYLQDFGFNLTESFRMRTQSYLGYTDMPHGSLSIEGRYFIPERDGQLILQFREMPYGDQRRNDSFEVNDENLPSVADIKDFIGSLGYREGVEIIGNDLASFKLTISKHLYKTPSLEYVFDPKSKFFRGKFAGEHKMTRSAFQQKITLIKDNYTRNEHLRSQL